MVMVGGKKGCLRGCLIVFLALIAVGVIGSCMGLGQGDSSKVDGDQAATSTEESSEPAAASTGRLTYAVDTGGAPTDDWPLYLTVADEHGEGGSDQAIAPGGGTLELTCGTHQVGVANDSWIASDGTLLGVAGVSPASVDVGTDEAAADGTTALTVSLQKVDPAQTSRDDYQARIDSACAYISQHEGQEKADQLRSLAMKLLPAENAPPATLTARYLDVGQGDSELVQLPDGKVMLIDAGEPDQGSKVVSDIKALGISRIDYLVATHPHADHIGGMADVIRTFDIGEVWSPNATANTQAFESFTGAVAAKGLTINAGSKGKDIVAPGTTSYDIQILGPDASVSSEDLNNYSLVIRVRFGQTSFLFTGDAPKDEIAGDVGEHVDVLKVAHHGSDTGTDASLARTLSPKIAVISYGLGNDYGHPKQGVLDALAACGAQVLGTGANGTVTVTSDGTNVSASPEHEGTVQAGSASSSDDSSKSSGSSAGSSQSDQGQASAAAAPAAAAPAAPADTGGDETVYVTPSGKKYHRQGCRTLKKSKTLIPMTKSEAQAQGYDACKVCNP